MQAGETQKKDGASGGISPSQLPPNRSSRSAANRPPRRQRPACSRSGGVGTGLGQHYACLLNINPTRPGSSAYLVPLGGRHGGMGRLCPGTNSSQRDCVATRSQKHVLRDELDPVAWGRGRVHIASSRSA